MDLLVLCLIAAAIAVFAHLRIRSFVGATMLVGVTASVLYQATVLVRLGYVDEFVSIALIVGAAICVAVATLTGMVVRLWRRKRP